MLHTLSELLKRDRQKLDDQIDELQKNLLKFPDGKLQCFKNGSYYKWYLKNETSSTYLSKKNKPLIQKLAAKQQYLARLDELILEREELNKLINKLSKRTLDKSSVLSNEECFQEMAAADFIQFPAKQQWMNASFETNPNHPEHLIYKTISGHMVRSKSEVIICNALFNNNIPFRYECALTLGNVTIYPDFTILDPDTLDLCYWEHFGLMDKEYYWENAYNKLKLYAQNQIIPTINLITTYETLQYPIDSIEVQELINKYFVHK